MSLDLWLAVVVTAVGTLLLRALPLRWIQHRRDRALDTESSPAEGGLLLQVLGPMMIAAMLGVSLVPSLPSVSAWSATVVASVATVIVWRRTKSLGIPVLTGVLVFGCVSFTVGALGA